MKIFKRKKDKERLHENRTKERKKKLEKLVEREVKLKTNIRKKEDRKNIYN
jgi:hypothetical protein